MDKRKKKVSVIAFFTILAVLYLAVFIYLAFFTNIYDISSAHNDRFFSSDDIYFVTSFFSTAPEPSLRVIKHPLLCAFGWLFTNLEHIVFPGGLSLTHHYEAIVLFQMALSWLSSLFLFKTVTEHHGVEHNLALSATALYALAFSTVFYTFIAESFIFSSFALILTYYFARKGNYVVTALLGALCAGITITNSVVWALIVFFTYRDSIWKRLALLISGGAAFCLLVYITPFRETFFQNIISGGLRSAENYSDSFPIAELVPRVFYVLFGSTLFYLDTFNASPFGEFQGDSLSFAPSAPYYVTIACIIWLALIVTAIVLSAKSRLSWAPIAVILFNLVLHGVIQYGLKEGFLYSLHHLSGEILLVSMLLSKKHGAVRYAVFAAIIALCACEIVFNLPGYIEMLGTVR